MISIGKFMQADQIPTPGSKVCKWRILGQNGATLGHVTYHCGWRKYVFEPEAETIFDNSCLADLCSFLYKHKDDRNDPMVGMP